ncbi:hypothetical protein [Pseudomarimonas salicorniae]|uniref:Lipoprotein n=1 Tax=Pseudomarimonas salicorniae TaxID=2933270 RepID=A0ABT0GLP1_9GAMM|nr:hypothetical protein [Lysobacter sp. CAU 1642]MCK7595461.1 hypothetical protein [Lysobacter sp. CAU 1642]
MISLVNKLLGAWGMRISPLMVAVPGFLLVLGGCGGSGGGSDQGGQGAQVTVAECVQFLEKQNGLSGLDPDVVATLNAQAQSDCARFDIISRADFECAMKADSESDLAACNVVLRADRAR